MQHPFIEFLIERDLIPASVGKRLMDQRSYIREPIGMIAVGHGILRPNEIDIILDRQRERKELRFGEVAIELGFLTEQQVEILVKVQAFRTSADISEALALAGVLSCEDAARYLGTFLVCDREMAEMMSEG